VAEPALVGPPGTGNGLLGMRERAAVFGGSLRAGPRPEGGFQVRVKLPLDPSAL
jgi:signal transduction histidine kinase